MEKLNFVVLRGFPRHSTRFAKEYFKNKKIIAVEIGTYEGYNAKSILRELNVGKFYIIDPYENYLDYASSEPDTVTTLICARAKAKKRLKKYKNKIIWIKRQQARLARYEGGITVFDENTTFRTRDHTLIMGMHPKANRSGSH